MDRDITVTLVRHTSVEVPTGVCYGQTDVRLRATFPAEAADVRHRLGNRHYDNVFTSPLSRCTRLAEACGFPDATRDPRLMEMNFGLWEMQPWDSITDPRLQRWFDDWANVAPPAGESFMDQQARLRSFLASLPSGSSNLVFTHGGILMHALLLTGRARMDNIFKSQPPYGGIVEI